MLLALLIRVVHGQFVFSTTLESVSRVRVGC